MRIILIRHGQTKGNLEKRYIGSTDDPLCKEGIEEIKNSVKANRYPDAGVIYVSPLKRCRTTAELIYPDKEHILCENLRECDFGELENKSYLELAENENYRNWINSNGTLEFPSGEKQESFRKRCQEAYETILDHSNPENIEDIALIVHGGTIMAILEKYGVPKKGFYDWQLKNGEGYVCELAVDKRSLNILEKLGDTGDQI